MMRTPTPTGALTGLEAALGALLDGVPPAAPRLVPLGEALGRVAAKMSPIAASLPARHSAAIDGWACRAVDLLGASAYSPSALPAVPVWIETGDAMPEGCDCVLQADLVDCSGPTAQAFGEAAPGQGVRRAGEDMAGGSLPAVEGKVIRAADLLVARKGGLSKLAVRVPRVRAIDVAAASGEAFSSRFIADSLKASGAAVAAVESTSRDAASVAAALDGEDCDLILLIGGTGDGRTDATVEALARRGVLIAHRIAVQPGGATAIGRLGNTPVIALPGSPDQAFGAYLALVQPVLDRLSGLLARAGIVLPLSRKISSAIGICEIVLLGREQDRWAPLAVGDFSLDAMRLADAWLAVPGDSEGYAVGAPVAAISLRDPD